MKTICLTLALALAALMLAPSLPAQSNPSVTVQLYPGLTINGAVGSSYAIQYNTSLAQSNGWQTLTNLVLPATPYLWMDQSAPATASRFYRVIPSSQNNAPAPAGMTLVPAGSFVMGDSLDGESDASTNTEFISAFYMDTNLVSLAFWQQVYQWATANGYNFDNGGTGNAANQPVQSINWYDAVKWCNARSQMSGVPSVYYLDAGLTQVYTSGDSPPYVNWSAPGFRLPTEAEWEKAARGGLAGCRFPMGNSISQGQANYYGNPGDFFYDLGPSGYNPAFGNGLAVDTSPVGYFPANGYSINDMAGNLSQWCWDWYGPYISGVQSNPHGATTGNFRVLRGGSWLVSAYNCRVANRSYYYAYLGGDGYGFRTVLAPSSQ